MKRKFTLLIAALALLTMIVQPGRAWGQAPVNTVLWSETWTGGTYDENPSDYGFEGTTIYNNATLTYSQNNPNTRVYNATLAGGTTPELLLQSGDSWTITNIPTGAATELTLTYKSNNTKSSVTCSTEGTTITGSSKSYTIEPGDNSAITLVFGCSGNTRIDDITLIVKTAGGGTPTVATPTFNPAEGTYYETQNVSILCSTDDATIYYTTNGDDPTTSSNIYSAPLSINTTTTIKALATKSGMDNSAIASATYTISESVEGYDIDFEYIEAAYANWTFTNMESHQTGSITAHDGTYYGTTGGKATASITTKEKVANPGTLTCFVSKQSGNTTSSTWYIQVSGNGSEWTNVKNQSATSMSSGTWVKFTADLSSYSDVYVRVYYTGSTAVRNIDDLSLTTATPATVATPTFSPASGTEFGNEGLEVTISQADNKPIYYTLNGSEPTSSSTLYEAPFQITTTTTVKARAYDGENASNVATAIYTYVDPDAPGTQNNPYTVAQAIANTPSGGNVYIQGIVSAFYNTSIVGDGTNYRYYISDDGTTTSQLLVYKGKGLNQTTFTNADDLLVGDEVVIYGTLNTYNNAPQIAAGNYLYSWNRPSAPVATPTFNPEAGVYTEAQNVEISCETEGSTIYYTTDGTEPTNASTEYTGAISVTETTTIKAIAYVGEEYSSVATATYTIQAPLATMDEIFAAATAAGTTAVQHNISFNNWIVSGASNRRAYITDGTKGFVIYDSNNQLAFVAGQILNGTKSCNVELKGGASQVTGLNVSDFSDITTGSVTIVPTTIDALDPINTGSVVNLGILTYNGSTLVDENDNEITPYNGIYDFAALVSGTSYNVKGVYTYYNVDEILPRDANDIVEVSNPTLSLGGPIINIGETHPTGVEIAVSITVTQSNLSEDITLTATHGTVEPNSVEQGAEPTEVVWKYTPSEAGAIDETVTATSGETTATLQIIGEAKAPHNINIAEIANGTVEADKATAIEGENVDLTITPDEGYALATLTVVDANDNPVPFIIPNTRFQMPDSDVTVYATFEEATQVTDVLTRATTGVTGQSYEDWDNVTVTSAAVYQGNSAGGNEAIQLRTKNSSSGIITTTSGGKIAHIAVVWEEHTTEGRTLDVYGKNTAYEDVADLYDSNTCGTLLGSIEYGTSTELTISGDYEYLGLRSHSDALYLTSISITWNTAPAPVVPIINAEDVTVAYEASTSSIIYGIENYEEGTISAATTASWITNFEYEQAEEMGVVTFNVSENEGGERSATVTLTWTYGDEQTVTTDVTVTQAGAPSVTVNPNAITIAATGDVPEFTITYESLDISDVDNFDVQFYEIDGTTEAEKPDWINGDPEIDGDVEDGFTVTMMITENTAEERYAYFRVYAMDDNAVEKYSNLVTITQSAPAGQTVQYTLITSVDDLTPGYHYLIASEAAVGELNIMDAQNSNNRGVRSATVDEYNTITFTPNDAYYDFVISGDTNNGWTIYDESTTKTGYLYAASSTKNYLRTQSSNDANGIWSITINNEGVATIVAQGSNTRNTMQYNSSNSLFACYGSASESDVYLYKKVGDTNPVYYSPTEIAVADPDPTSEPIIVVNNEILVLSGDLSNCNNPDNLIIEDGGQLVFSGTGVQATMKKSTAHAGAKDVATDWYTIASPLAANVATNAVGNLTNGTYDLYRYNEAAVMWENAKDTEHSGGFNELTVGRGYLYWNGSGSDITFAGELRNADVAYTLKADGAGNYKGFNLIGNPFSQNITMSNITGVTLSGGYVLTQAGGWGASIDEIAPCQGFLVQVEAETDITITKPTSSGKSRANRDYIALTVANSEYEDVTYALFSDGMGLSKINHRNADIPMLYIPQNDKNYAIATMDDNTQAFNLNFKAMTTGQYTLSFKAQGSYSYLHVIDRITGEDIDMLLDGEYTFIGSPRDNENRFIVKLNYNANIDELEAGDSFAYQYGNGIIVNGKGELQVFDVNGRMVMNTVINGKQTVNVPTTGLYIFRMVGESVKTQKIVVR